MLTQALRSKVDQLWDRFWSGGIANPLEVIELLLAQRDLEVHFQGIFDIGARRRRVIGAEALLRWRHPTRGYIPPQAFIPVAVRPKPRLRAVSGQVKMLVEIAHES